MKSEENVAAIVDPSISGEFPDITDYRKFVEMIRSLGFKYVNEVSFGVDLVAKAYKMLFDEKKGKYYITANCPAIVYYIEKYFPSLIGNIAPIITPVMATANVVRELTVRMSELFTLGLVLRPSVRYYVPMGVTKIDSVLTFRELRKLFSEKKYP